MIFVDIDVRKAFCILQCDRCWCSVCIDKISCSKSVYNISQVFVGEIHNVELKPGKGGQIARSAGCSAQILGSEGKYVLVRLSSGEVRRFLKNCRATIGEVGNGDHANIQIGKAGRKRHMGIRPTVRGSVMNPNDHPHGGGEGRAPIGRKGPVTPWGKPALGYKTRKKNKASNQYIVKRRNEK